MKCIEQKCSPKPTLICFLIIANIVTILIVALKVKGILLHYASALYLAGEQFMNPGQGPSSGISEQYNRPPGPISNMQLGHRQPYGPYGPGYERRYCATLSPCLALIQ